MSTKRIVYLTGAGATKGELELAGVKSDTTMNGIRDSVMQMSKEADGRYYEFVQDFGIPPELDVEKMMSLFEDIIDPGDPDFNDISSELRRLFRDYLISQINQRESVPRLLIALLGVNKKYGDYMGENGEEMMGVLTINYDSLLDEAFCTVYDGLNCGYEFKSSDYRMDDSIPPLLKLHGSFNWMIQDSKLEISKDFESDEYQEDYSGWIPPSVFKKPSEAVIMEIWRRAKGLLVSCDVLRVVGSNLRNEDWALISLLFSSQVKSNPRFNIELIVPENSASGGEKEDGIMDRLPFLGNLKPMSSLGLFEEGDIIGPNVFHSWLLKKIEDIEKKNEEVIEDEFIVEILYGGE